jgi:hypothetical protein
MLALSKLSLGKGRMIRSHIQHPPGHVRRLGAFLRSEWLQWRRVPQLTEASASSVPLAVRQQVQETSHHLRQGKCLIMPAPIIGRLFLTQSWGANGG